jgi:NadR type nicotinamide-nucleotide adenylyltransferase
MLPLTVVIIGSECTGKTTLAARLSERFRAPWSGEFAREYVGRKQAELDASDVEPIARGQLAAEQQAEREASEQRSRLVIRDTDLHSTAVYSRHYYGSCPDWIAATARERTGDLYVLLAPDVPWVPDGLFRDRPEEALRAEIHRLFREALVAAGAKVIEITGTWTEREAAATEAIAAALAARR